MRGHAMKVIRYNGRRNISGEQIREARLRLRLSQAQLAARMQTEGVLIEQDALSRIESGDRLVQDFELKALAKSLHVSVDWLLNRDE